MAAELRFEQDVPTVGQTPLSSPRRCGHPKWWRQRQRDRKMMQHLSGQWSVDNLPFFLLLISYSWRIPSPSLLVLRGVRTQNSEKQEVRGEERAARLGGCRQEGHYPGQWAVSPTAGLCHHWGLLAFPVGSSSIHITDLQEPSAWAPRMEESPQSLGKLPEVK